MFYRALNNINRLGKEITFFSLFTVIVMLIVLVSLKSDVLFAQTTEPTNPTPEQIKKSIDNLPISTDRGVPEIDEQVAVTISPQNPAPGQNVSITLEAYGININASNIEWRVNGVSVQKGTGLTRFSIKAGAAGSNTVVRFILTSPEGKVTTKDISIRPQTVSLIYESRSYIPPFYKGRSLYSLQGNLVFLAVPNLINKSGQQIDPNTLIYKWIVDGEVYGSDSGYGKSTFIFSGPTLVKNTVVGVEVSSKDGVSSGDAQITVIPQNPTVRLYEKRPLLGILFNQALNNQVGLNLSEITVEAFPYFFDAESKNSNNIEYSWSLNDEGVSLPPNQNRIVLRNAGGTTGQSNISVIINNTSQFLQKADQGINVLFGKSSNAAVF